VLFIFPEHDPKITAIFRLFAYEDSRHITNIPTYVIFTQPGDRPGNHNCSWWRIMRVFVRETCAEDHHKTASGAATAFVRNHHHTTTKQGSFGRQACGPGHKNCSIGDNSERDILLATTDARLEHAAHGFTCDNYVGMWCLP
jgi:hypothetical protein